MKKLINMISEFEYRASEMYRYAASFYLNDDEMRNFLNKNADEEAYHYQLMEKAAHFVDSETDIVPVISIDEETNNRILNQISTIMNELNQNTFSRKDLIRKIVEFELLEWNEIFLYVVDFLKDKYNNFKYSAARIQSHIKEIELFAESEGVNPDIIGKIKKLQPIWVENILIVDDEEIITKLMRSLLYDSGNIDVAQNGKEALKLLAGKYYKLILSDINMPIMDGISLYKSAVEKYPALKKRFLFMTGYLSPERQVFLEEKHLKYLKKPIEISKLREEALEILLSN